MANPVESPAMTPIKRRTIKFWVCRHCEAEKEIVKGEPQPPRCWNYKCRRVDWNRDKIKEGRPRKDEKPKRKESTKGRNHRTKRGK